MSRRNLIGWVILVVVGFGLLAPIGYFLWTRARGVSLIITNSTSHTLEHVEMAYTGGVIRIAALPPKASYGRRINPTDESAVRLKWVDASGVEHVQVIGVYIEPKYTGRLRIVVEPNDAVTWIDRTTPYFFLPR